MRFLAERLNEASKVLFGHVSEGGKGKGVDRHLAPLGIQDVEDEVDRTHGAQNQEWPRTSLRKPSEPLRPVPSGRSVGQSRFLNVEKHRIEGSECAKSNREIEELLNGCATVVEPGCSNELVDECAVGLIP